MKILKVIHGYPMRYNAGSEVYSQTLCHALAEQHEVQVFTRQENPFLSDYAISRELDKRDPRILLNIINLPRERNRDRFLHQELDEAFEALIQDFKPHIVHIGHLNHLSTGIVKRAKKHNIPIVYTLHDYWLLCPRGQFIQRNSSPPLQLCEGQDDYKCAKQCYKGNCTGENNQIDLIHLTDWVKRRMQEMAQVAQDVDYFLAPSQTLKNKFVNQFPFIQNKITYMDYGFDLERFQERKRLADDPFVFGYIGTHIPAKGIQHLIDAFGKMKNENALLRIWGRERGENTPFLRDLIAALPSDKQKQIQWMGEYANENIVEDVFNKVDAIVVPSIWLENSPLVIHEAQQVKVPVITTNLGGMAEYVQDEVNGLLFKVGNSTDLAIQMDRFSHNPKWAATLGERGYLYSKDRQIPCIKKQAQEIEKIYQTLLDDRRIPYPKKPGPWRITFDTNPDTCNFKCIMCECFSPYSKVKDERVAQKIPKRLMDIQLITKILDEAKDTPLREIIPSTMGEPLLYKAFDKIIELCHFHHLKMNLTTNGSFPIKGVEKWAELLLPVLSDIKISWNGATKETHEKIMLHSKWEQVLKNLEMFLELRDAHAAGGGNRPSVTLQLTFLETNLQDIPKLVEMAIKLGVDRIKGHHLWAHFDEIKNLSMRRNKEAILQWNKIAEKAIAIANKNKLRNGHFLKLENIHPIDLEAEHDLAPQGKCPFLGGEAWVNTEGRFSPCCAPDEQRKSLGRFGNLNQMTMEEIWTSPQYKHLQKTYINHPLCHACNMKKTL